MQGVQGSQVVGAALEFTRDTEEHKQSKATVESILVISVVRGQ